MIMGSEEGSMTIDKREAIGILQEHINTYHHQIRIW